MGTKRVAEPPSVAESPVISARLDQFGCRPVHFAARRRPHTSSPVPSTEIRRCARPAQGCVFARVLRWPYDNEAETRAAPDPVFSNYFSPNGPGVFEPLRETLLTGGDYSMHLADLKSYLQAQDRLGDLDTNQDAWAPKAILNVVSSKKSSSDRSIAEYAADIWGVSPCPVQ